MFLFAFIMRASNASSRAFYSHIIILAGCSVYCFHFVFIAGRSIYAHHKILNYKSLSAFSSSNTPIKILVANQMNCVFGTFGMEMIWFGG